MTGWHKASMIGFDLETSGVNLETDRIVTACVALIRPDVDVEVRATVVNPGIAVPDEAAKIHGYTTERVQAEGKDPATEIDWVTADLASAIKAGIPIVGMNCVFDLTILDREARRLGLPTLEDRIGGPVTPVVDVYTIDRALDRYRRGSRKLTNLCEHYGVRLDGAHDATFDALAAARVAWRIGQRSHMAPAELRALYADRRYPDRIVKDWLAFSQLTLEQLHTAQVSWFAEQAEGLTQWWRQKANEARHTAEVAAENGRHDDAAIAEAEADELDARVDSMCSDWPFRPYIAEGVAA
jgi:DNA polymerase III subunit epsilon